MGLKLFTRDTPIFFQNEKIQLVNKKQEDRHLFFCENNFVRKMITKFIVTKILAPLKYSEAIKKTIVQINYPLHLFESLGGDKMNVALNFSFKME